MDKITIIIILLLYTSNAINVFKTLHSLLEQNSFKQHEPGRRNINNGRSKYVIRTVSDKIMYKSQQNHEFIAHMHGLVLIRQENIAARMKNLRKIAEFFYKEQGSDQ